MQRKDVSFLDTEIHGIIDKRHANDTDKNANTDKATRLRLMLAQWLAYDHLEIRRRDGNSSLLERRRADSISPRDHRRCYAAIPPASFQ